jgi:hypothetical protein
MISVSPNSLSMLTDVDFSHDFIQFETGSASNKSD